MTTLEIRDKLTRYQSQLSSLQRDEKSLLEELKSLGVNSLEEAKAYMEKLSKEDITKLESEVKELEVELQKWLA
jgi:seryl-tRNA synthetase